MSYEAKGAPGNIATGQVTINSSTAVQVVPARATRRKLRIYVLSGGFYVGDSGLAIGNGYLVAVASGQADAFIELETADAVYALSAASATALSFLETYD